MIIYKATNKINGKGYIGQTSKTLKERMASHTVETKNGGSAIHRAISKYGMSNFEWDVICHCKNKEELNLMEVQYIQAYQTKKPNGYNLTEGGGGISGFKMTEETKKRQSQVKIGQNNPMYGKKRPGLKAHLGYPMSEETKARLSFIMKGRPSPRKGCIQPSTRGENNVSCRPEVRQKKREKMLGRKFGPVPDERKKRMSLSHKGKKFSEEHKLNISNSLKNYWSKRNMT